MTVVEEVHADHGAAFVDRGDRRVVANYGRTATTHRAVRQGVGTIEMGYGVVVLTGADRVDFVDNVVSNRVPATDGEGCYALLLDPQGAVETDCYVYNADERLLVLTPPGRAEPLASDWEDKTFIQDVDVRAATDEFAVFGVHGPQATENVASVLTGAATPEERRSFVRGSIGDAGVTVIRGDGLAGEEGFEVVCAADAATQVFRRLLTRGLNAVPFGYDTWATLTAEAGTPLFEPDLRGRIPNEVGVRTALDFEKGCYVGQEVVSRIENRGAPAHRLVGIAIEGSAIPGAEAAVLDGDANVGEITRAVESPSLETGIGLAVVDADASAVDTAVSVRVDGTEVPATVTALPFVEGSETSARVPEYPS
jgi:aminomethyltransferase